jgi:hypothetical protein
MSKTPTPPTEAKPSSESAIAGIVTTIEQAIDAFTAENAALRQQDFKAVDVMRVRKLRLSADLQQQKALLEKALSNPAADAAARGLVSEKLSRLREVARENCSLLNASKVVTHMRIEAVMAARQQAASAGNLYDRGGRQIRVGERDAGALKPNLRI